MVNNANTSFSAAAIYCLVTYYLAAEVSSIQNNTIEIIGLYADGHCIFVGYNKE